MQALLPEERQLLQVRPSLKLLCPMQLQEAVRVPSQLTGNPAMVESDGEHIVLCDFCAQAEDT